MKENLETVSHWFYLVVMQIFMKFLCNIFVQLLAFPRKYFLVMHIMEENRLQTYVVTGKMFSIPAIL